jgi:tetratricopeptide (TPR) repeat protein
MKKNPNAEQLKQFLAIFTQLGPIIAAVGMLIGLIFGDLPDIRYRQTLSALIVLVIAILIWIWRWPRITQSRRQRNSSAASKKDTAPVKGIMSPFVEAQSNHFVLSLTRRRVEGFLLILVTAGALIFISQKTTQIVVEVSGVQCSYAADRKAPLLVIFEFNNLTDRKDAFVNRLYTEMDERFNNQISVCLSQRVIANSTEAENYGRNLNRQQSVTIVVWGDSDDSSYEIHITPIEWTAFELLLKANAADANVLDNWARNYLPKLVVGMTQFVKGDYPKAIQAFNTVVNQLGSNTWSGDNQRAFARLYFRLAQLHDNNGNVQDAIETYDKVLSIDPEFYSARLNRGMLYVKADREKALEDFTTLIDQRADNAADAYVNRASLQTEWSLQKRDYLGAIALEPNNADYYDYFGVAALSAGDFDAAYNAYKDANKSMDEETRTGIINELQTMAKQDDTLTEVVGRIVTLLQRPTK